MLVLHHVAPEVDPELAVDEFVPLAVEVPGERSPEGTLYWRLKHDPTTLIEIGVSEGSGRLQSITVTAVDGRSVVVVGAKPLTDVNAGLRGVPCFDLGSWAVGNEFGSRFRDEDLLPKLLVGAGACGLDFGTPFPPVQAISFGAVRCLFSAEGNLVRVEVDKLDNRAERILRELAA